MTTVGEKIPHDAKLSKIVIGPNEVLVLQLAAPMPDGFMEQVAELMAHLPRHATVLVFESNVSISTASEEDLRAALAEIERKNAGQPALRCPTCDSPSPNFMPATQHEGEVIAICPDPWHQTGP